MTDEQWLNVIGVFIDPLSRIHRPRLIVDDHVPVEIHLSHTNMLAFRLRLARWEATAEGNLRRGGSPIPPV
jgi:hypothetical protein